MWLSRSFNWIGGIAYCAARSFPRAVLWEVHRMHRRAFVRQKAAHKMLNKHIYEYGRKVQRVSPYASNCCHTMGTTQRPAARQGKNPFLNGFKWRTLRADDMEKMCVTPIFRSVWIESERLCSFWFLLFETSSICLYLTSAHGEHICLGFSFTSRAYRFRCWNSKWVFIMFHKSISGLA